MSSEPKARFSAYKNALKSISARTGAPLPSLILSFGILHEITAIAPLFGIFYASRSLGIGERVVDAIIQHDSAPSTGAVGWTTHTLREWVEEGDRWAGKVGRRYGIFGYEKRVPGTVENPAEPAQFQGHIAGDVANAVVAYAVTKAILPVRIGASLYLSPMFSRRIVEPLRKFVMRPFRRD